MKTKTFSPGDRVKIRTRDRSWEGYVLESHDSELQYDAEPPVQRI